MLLTLGAISLSAAMAPPASAQFVDPNASGCRSAIGIAVNRGCLSAKPENYGVAHHNDTLDTAEKSAGIAQVGPHDPVIEHKDKDGNIFRVDYPKQGYSDWSYPNGIVRVYSNGDRDQLVYSTHKGGNGGAAGRTGSRIAAPLPGDARTGASVAPPKAAVPKSTTTDKATNTTTRDYRTGATAAPGGPPPAAAIGTKPTAAQMTAQSAVRDHRQAK